MQQTESTKKRWHKKINGTRMAIYFFLVDYLPQNKLLIDIDIVKLKYIVKILRSYFLTKIKSKDTNYIFYKVLNLLTV